MAQFRRKISLPTGLYYQFPFISRNERKIILDWIKTLHPLWEMRFSQHNPPPEGDFQRQLKRPVYWLGNWQFACLDYYHPPKGIENRCVKAEPYPEFLAVIVKKIEFLTKKNLSPFDIPKDWTLNTCLINFYGDHFQEGKWVDVAKVGEHKDFEPGPVASLSIGEKAFFQFMNGKSKLGKENEVFSMWLEDSSLQIFGGNKWKKETFHRVQRVESKLPPLDIPLPNFKTRRINFTFRYVPKEHIKPWSVFPNHLKEDTQIYINELAQFSSFFKELIEQK
jgi:alkylated DNA repair protein (DNA oxidative demethylase)